MLEARLLDVEYLLMDQPLALQVAHEFGQRVGRDRLALGRAHVFEPLWRLLELRIGICGYRAVLGLP